MKLHLITSMWPSKDNPISGIFVAEQASALVDAGHEVWVTVASPSKKQWSVIEDIEPRFMRTLYLPTRFGTIHRVANTKVAARVARWTLPRHEADAVIVHNQLPLGFCVPWWQTKEVPTAVVVHGAAPPLAAKGYANWLKQHLPELGSNVNVIPVGTTLLPYLQQLGVRHDAVLGNGTNYADVAQGSSVSKTVVCIANLHKEKGVDVLLSAFSHLDSLWQLRIVGDGPERAALERQALALGLDRVEFLGRLEREATLKVLEHADLFALPSVRESFGLVFLEAAMRGIPAVGCLGTGAEEIIRDGVSGKLVAQGDPLAVAEALEQMHLNRDAWGAAARENALGRTWERYNKELLAILGVG
ncbi:glycosyltransferase family 4 protein [Corynebacterium gerontici]|uniref:D-inositol 3-phosphate glycosyltransferase n=1 Tax=Corynebacterium gerontici TaxID=2079234 RepID=A0A3G6IXD0_9CORY|nr:glycosyltransferase family 4 protein [Corynebacterium gerontici]AZA10431.1 D-inositol 3-phosphate glycosyltransferase [Corynebacterium gerontici]